MISDENVLVIDDFLQDAESFRTIAVGASYPAPRQAQYFAGRVSAKRYPNATIDSCISHIVGQSLAPMPGALHGAFRLCLHGETGKGGVHVDPCHWAGLLFLSRPEHYRGGLDFFRHRESGQVAAPIHEEDWRHWNMTREQFFHEVMLAYATNAQRWERTQHVEMKFNRLVLYRPWLWHNLSPGFGDRPEDGALSYLMFYHANEGNER